MDGDVDGINAGVGIGAVCPLAVDGNPEAVRGEHHGAGGVVHIDAHGSPAGGDMISQRSIGSGILKNAVVDHVHCTLKRLFRRLEHELDGALQICLIFLQHFGSGQKHGGMKIVAAGVGGGAGGTGKVQAGFLCHGQSVHVSPEQQTFAASANGGRNAMTAGVGIDAQLFQLFQDISLAFGHIQADFGVDMEKPAVGNGLVLQGQCSFVIVHK